MLVGDPTRARPASASPPTSDSAAAGRRSAGITALPPPGVRLPDGRPVRLPVGRTGGGLVGMPAGLAAELARTGPGLVRLVVGAGSSAAFGRRLRRLSTGVVCVRTSSVRSRSVTSSGVAK